MIKYSKFHNLELCGIRVNVYNDGVFPSSPRIASPLSYLKQIVLQIVLIISSLIRLNIL